MPFDGSGTFNRTRSWAADEQQQIKIRSDYHDTHDSDLANGLSNCITKNGATQPTANIPMNAKRLVNLGAPVSAQDAATKAYVDNFRTYTTSIHITGADANGMLVFDSATGSNGLSWANAGVGQSFVARKAKASETTNRWAFNNTAAATAGAAYDVLVIDERGMIYNNGQLANNLSRDPAGTWRTVSPGYGALLSYAGNGDLTLASNDVATITNPFMPATLRTFAQFKNDVGNCTVMFDKSTPIAGVQKTVDIYGTRAGVSRWLIRLGGLATETATDRVGSDFEIYSYANAGGATHYLEMKINRQTHAVTFGGLVTTKNGLDTTDAACIISANTGGSITLRPDGAASTTGQAVFSSAGDLSLTRYLNHRGVLERAGTAVGAEGSEYVNFIYTDVAPRKFNAWVNTTFVGQLLPPTLDYRVMRDAEPMGSVWDTVKALRPIRFKTRDYSALDGTRISEDSDAEQWGFVAHELQETLGERAATGSKDAENLVQSIDLQVLVTALTATIQEAMSRIEALEAA